MKLYRKTNVAALTQQLIKLYENRSYVSSIALMQSSAGRHFIVVYVSLLARAMGQDTAFLLRAGSQTSAKSLITSLVQGANANTPPTATQAAKLFTLLDDAPASAPETLPITLESWPIS